MTALRFPWEIAPPPGTPPKRAPAAPKPRGRRKAAASPAGPVQPWRCHHLIITGPAESLAAFAQAARGPGITPWPHDGQALEEDVFHLAVSLPARRRSLTVEGCRILARQFRDRVEARQARMDGLAQAQACPFDLHALLPVPEAILHLGPDHQDARAWIATHWGMSDRPRKVASVPAANVPRPRPAGHAAIGYGFFAGGRDTPALAVTALAAKWPALRFTLRERPG